MNRWVPVLAFCMLLLGMPASHAYAASEAAVSGVVRDLQGKPQMGAIVELLHADATVVARAVTDEHGRYLLTALLPGTYQLRATAAYLLPALRDRLELPSGGRAIANLTLTAIFSARLGLPAEKRRANEAADDWRWTLRSAANRPLLRLVDGEGGIRPEAERTLPVSGEATRTGTSREMDLTAGNGSFGEGGTRETLSLVSDHRNGMRTSLRSSVAETGVSGQAVPLEAAASLDRSGMTGGTHFMVGIATHPELASSAGQGFQLLRIGSAEQILLGDAVVIDAGTLLSAERLLERRVFATPYLSVKAKAAEGIAVEYRLTEGHTFRSADLVDLDTRADLLADASGRPLQDKGLYQEFAISQSAQDGANMARIAVSYASPATEILQGIGRLQTAELNHLPVVVDGATGTFHTALNAGPAFGLGMSWTHRIAANVAVNVQDALGTALVLDGSPELATLQPAIRERIKNDVRASLSAKAHRTGTAVRASYGWQSQDVIRGPATLEAEPNDGYLGFSLKQQLGATRHLHGINAVIEASNLLAQGYQPVVGPDGETLFLAQIPRVLQAGISFSF